MTHADSHLGRRDVLRGGIALASLSLAGCSGGGESSLGDGQTDAPQDGGGGVDSGADVGGGSGSGAGAGGGSDGGAGGSGTNRGDPTGAVGQVVSGEYADFAVEYVRPVESVMDYREVPQTDEDAQWGVSRDLASLQEMGFARGATGMHGVGIAIKNRGEGLLSVQTTMLQGTDSMHMGVFMGRSQRLTFSQARGGGGVNLRPGEVVRAELVFALPDAPSNYQLVLVPIQLATAQSEKLYVDLGAGSDAEAPLSNEVEMGSPGTATRVGDFDVTLHSVSTAASVSDSPYEDLFGPREGYEYVLIDVTATRVSEESTSQDWGFGVVDGAGYRYMWSHGLTFQDRTQLDRTTLEDLPVGETLAHSKFAFPIETGFDPVALAFEARGPYEDTVIDAGQSRALWPIA